MLRKLKLNLAVVASLYAEAAYAFPEGAQKWMPEWLTKHKAFQANKSNNIFKIFKQFGISDFRQDFKDNSVVEYFKDLLISQIANLISRLQNETEYISVGQVSTQFLKELMKPSTWSAGKARLTSQIASTDKKIRFDTGTSIVKVYDNLKVLSSNIFTLKSLESTQQFKDYSRRESYTLVFSTKPEDIASMSSRSSWTSCQDIRNVDRHSYNQCVVGSTLSKFIGIIYITNNKDYSDRGEEMVVRSLVRFVVDTKTNEPTIFIDKMYPGYQPKFAKLMQGALQQRTQVRVIDVATTDKSLNQGRFRLPKEEIKELGQGERPYIDEDTIALMVPNTIEQRTNKLSVAQYIRSVCSEINGWLAGKITNFLIKKYGFDQETAGKIFPAHANPFAAHLLANALDKIGKNKDMSRDLIKKYLIHQFIKVSGDKELFSREFMGAIHPYHLENKFYITKEKDEAFRDLVDFAYDQIALLEP